MQSLVRFWKKDIINKLIVLVLLALAGGVIGIAALAFNMPQGKEFTKAFTDLLPVRSTPTFDVNLYLTPGAVQVTPLPTLTPTPRPTITSRPSETPTLALEQPSPTPASILTVEPAAASQPQPGPACLPNNPRLSGQILDVVDAVTVRAMIDGLVYTVRYIGVTKPDDDRFLLAARSLNSKLVYGKFVTIIADVEAKDERGRSLYYVLLDGQLVNLELIRQGLGLAHDAPPNSSCAALFQQAQQDAMNAKVGQWSVAP